MVALTDSTPFAFVCFLPLVVSRYLEGGHIAVLSELAYWQLATWERCEWFEKRQTQIKTPLEYFAGRVVIAGTFCKVLLGAGGCLSEGPAGVEHALQIRPPRRP